MNALDWGGVTGWKARGLAAGLLAGAIAFGATWSHGSLGAWVGAEEPAAESQMLLRHVVLFKFKDSSSPEDVQRVVDAFRKLPQEIPQIASFEFGVNNSPENLNDGFTHSFLVTFRSAADRDIYLPHAAHRAFVEVLKPHLDRVLVVDYFAGQ
jgi:hypothetical protein